ncbi:MAG: response regulator [Pseudomonadota bacterium]|nr:response regulator [Pseudomonadota bacterium]
MFLQTFRSPAPAWERLKSHLSPALAMSCTVVLAFVVVIAVVIQLVVESAMEESKARVRSAVEVLANEIASSLRHTDDVLQQLARTIEIYGPGIVADDIDPRWATNAEQRNYLGISVWSTFGDLMVTTDEAHWNYDLKQAVSHFMYGEGPDTPPILIEIEKRGNDAAETSAQFGIAHGLYEDGSLIGLTMAEVSIPHLFDLLEEVRKKTGADISICYRGEPLIDVSPPRLQDSRSHSPNETRLGTDVLYGFSVEAVLDETLIRQDAIWSLRLLLAVLCGILLTLIAFAVLLVIGERKLRAEMERTNEAANAKAQFLANMSHEIRTPINGIIGMAEFLDGDKLTLEQHECVETILGSSETLLTIINSILDFSKCEAGEQVLQNEAFSLYETIFDVAALLGPPVGGHEVEVIVNYDEKLPKWFYGDPERIRQIIVNLTGNAVKFTPKGEVVMSVTYEPEEALPLVVTIKDSGIGIAEEKLASIFDAFQQAEMHKARRFEGTGLGLTITRTLIENMGGDISVASRPGAGSTFAVRLPLEKATSVEKEHPISLEVLSGKNVLLVDDIELNRIVMKRTLEQWGVVVHCYPSPEAVLAMEPSALAKIDMGILDYNMPNMNGDELFRRLKTRMDQDTFPMILYSSGHQASDQGLVTGLGFDAVLMKPVRATALAQCLQNTLTGNRQKHKTKKPEGRADLSGTQILVAEDNRTNRLVLEKMLKPTQATLIFCEDGQAALNTYEHSYAEIDLVLMDFSMPVMDGLTASREIRDFEEAQHLPPCPIIALTANIMQTDRDASVEAGMNAFLTKPVRKQELLEIISKFGC